jgi:hypothetical protein
MFSFYERASAYLAVGISPGRHGTPSENRQSPAISGSSAGFMSRKSNPAHMLDACLRDKVKLERAYGGCLGSQRR